MLRKIDFPEQIVTDRTVVRKATIEDFDHIATWPEYPPTSPKKGVRMTAEFNREPNGRFWWQQIDRPERCHYSVVLPQTNEVIGVYAFVRIDWDHRVVRNMGCFIRPDLCHHGYGTETLRLLLAAVLDAGMRIVRLDVITTNPPAIRCYEKCGMQIVDEIHFDNMTQSYIMEISNVLRDPVPLEEAEVDRMVDTQGDLIMQRLAAFGDTGAIEYPLHVFLYRIAARKKTPYCDILKHPLLSYTGLYAAEEYLLLNDVFQTLIQMPAEHTSAVVSTFLQRLNDAMTHLKTLSVSEKDLYASQNVTNLITMCQEYLP